MCACAASPRPQGERVHLTNHEFNLLAAFLAAPQRLLSRSQLISLSRLHDDEIYDRSIDVQVSRLRRKVAARPWRAAVHPHRARRGLRLHGRGGRRPVMHLGFVFGPILAGAAFGVSGQRYTLDEFDLPPWPRSRGDAGTVVAVRETPITHRPHAIGSRRDRAQVPARHRRGAGDPPGQRVGHRACRAIPRCEFSPDSACACNPCQHLSRCFSRRRADRPCRASAR